MVLLLLLRDSYFFFMNNFIWRQLYKTIEEFEEPIVKHAIELDGYIQL